MTTSYIGLGGNLGDATAVLARFQRAAELLEATRLSRVYRSAPIGPVAEQPPFLNAAAELAWAGTPRALLERLLAVEQQLGRDRSASIPQGPRSIDLDLLLFGDLVLCEPGLVVPHPQLHRRRFALEPVMELAGPGGVIPGLGRTLQQCLAAPEVRCQQVTPL